MNRNQKAVARLLELASWILRSGGEPFTFAQVRSAFPLHYRGSQQADKAWTRDKIQLRRMGIRFEETAPGEYTLDRSSSRPTRVTLSPEEIALLNEVARAEAGLAFAPARHHVHVALRRLALAGAPISDAVARLAPRLWEDWRVEDDWLAMLKGIWSRRIPLLVDYPDGASGRVQRHTVKVYSVFFDAQVFVGDSDLSGRTTFFVPAVRSMKYGEGGRHAYEIPEDVTGGLAFVWDWPQLLDGTFPRPRAGRPVVQQLQRDLAAGYLLLGALFGASPGLLSWDRAIEFSGAADRDELLGLVETLESVQIPDIADRMGPLAIEKSEEGISLYLRSSESFHLALRPMEVAMLVAVARAIPGHAAAAATLGEKLLLHLEGEERDAGQSMARAFRFGDLVAPGS